MKRSYALLPLFFLLSLSLRAEHFAGGSITSVCTGNNFHDITLTLFLDCVGDPLGNQTLYFANSCGVVFTLAELAPVAIDEVSPLCPDQIQNSQCNGGALPGMVRYTFRTSVYLSPCAEWTISWRVCCRNNSVNLLGTPGMYLEEKLNNFTGVCNTSPVPVSETIPFVCLGQPVTHDASATDAENDILRYRLIDARYAAPDPTPVFYAADYNGAEPYTGLFIDSITGIIDFQPMEQGNIITVVEVRELNADGTEIGRVMRDFLFMVRGCSNAAPSVTSGTFTAVTGPATIAEERELLVCSSGVFCGSLAFTDSNLGEELTVTSNLESMLPGATISLNGTNPVAAQVCWNAEGVVPGRYEFTITAADNACPIPASQVFSYAVTVGEPTGDPGANGEAHYCLAAPAFILADSLQGEPDAGGSWEGPGGPFSGVFVPGISLPGNYAYTVTDEAGCSATANVLVSALAEEAPACITLGTQEHGRNGLLVRQDHVQHDRIWIVAGRTGIYGVSVYTGDGRLLMERGTTLTMDTPYALDLSTAPGVLLVRVHDARTGTAWSERLVLP